MRNTRPSQLITLIALAAIIASAACDGDDPSAADTGSGVEQGVNDGGVDGPAGDAKGDTGKVGDQKIIPDKPKKPAFWSLVQGKVVPIGEGQTVTKLNDGRVLVAGGEIRLNGNDDYLDKAYLYVPKEKKFIQTGTMVAPRTEHTATLLKDGRVLVVGGKNKGKYLKSAEFYDPKTGLWTAAPSMYQSRWGHAAVRLADKDNMVLVTGGFGSSDSISSMTLYHPGQKMWISPPASMNEARRYHTMTRLKSGKVLVVGGLKGSKMSEYYSSGTLELFDAGGTIAKLPDEMHWKRLGHTSTLLDTGDVLIIGGFCWKDCSGTKVNDLYQATTGKLTKLSYLGKPPTGHSSVKLKSGKVLTMGRNDNDAALRKQAVIYNPAGGLMTWTKAPDMLLQRSYPGAALLNDGTVLVVGGVETTKPWKYADKAEIYHP